MGAACVLAWMAAMPGLAGAAEPLSLQEALQRGLVAHPELVGSGFAVEQAEASLNAARGVYDTRLLASAYATHSETAGFIAGFPFRSTADVREGDLQLDGMLATGTAWSLTAGLERNETTTVASLGGQPPQEIAQLYWGANVELAVRQDLLAPFRSSDAVLQGRLALDAVDRATALAEEARQTAVADVAQAWWAWWGAAERVAVHRRALEGAEALEVRTRAWLDEGLVTGVDLARAEAGTLSARRDLIAALAEARRARDQVLVRIGESPGLDVVPGEGLTPGPAPDPEAVTARARATNPTLQQARLAVEQAEREARDARGALLPTLDAVGAAGVATLTDTARDAVTGLFREDDALPTLRGGLEVGLPFGNRAARGEADRLASLARQRRADLERLEREVEAEALAAVDAVRTALASLDLAEASLAVARRAEAAERARREEGVGRTVDLLDAITDRVAAEVAWVDARIALLEARLALARLEGRADTWLGV